MLASVIELPASQIAPAVLKTPRGTATRWRRASMSKSILVRPSCAYCGLHPVKLARNRFCSQQCGRRSRIPRRPLCRHCGKKPIKQSREVFCSRRCYFLSVAASPSERFWDRVSKRPSGCWEWTKGRNHKGYGCFHPGSGLTIMPHRFSWELHFGPIPDGLHVLHHCDNPPCVRPSHLFLGTSHDNHLDMVAKGRSSAGERHSNAKLTASQVATMRAKHASGGITAKRLASEYGISYSHARGILKGVSWK